ncbi:MAG: oligosaccharide flippase family protein [Psychromonas sp.]
MSIKIQALISSAWHMGAAMVNKIIILLVYVVIARFIEIEEFGYVAFAYLIFQFLSIFIGAGIKENLVKRDNWDDEYASSAFWLLLLISIIISILSVIIIPPIITHFYNKDMANIFISMSFIPIISAFRIIQTAKMEREFLYKSLAIRNVLASVIAGVVGIYLAIEGYGAWALVYNKFIFAVVSVLLLWWLSGFIPKFKFSKTDIKELYKFSLPIMGVEIITFWQSRVIDFIASIFLGPAAFALMDVGRKIINTFYLIVLSPLRNVSLSLLSRVNNDEKDLAYIKIVYLVSFFVYPLITVLGLHSEYVITLVFSDKWHDSVEIMVVFSYAVYPYVANWFSHTLMISYGQTSLLFKINVASMILMLIAALVCFPFGLKALVIGQVVIEYLLLFARIWILYKLIAFDYKKFFRYQTPVFLIGVFCILSFNFSENYFLVANSLLGYAISFASWLILYYVCILLLDRHYFKECYRLTFAYALIKLRGKS